MTKAELIAKLADCPDSCQVLIEPWPEDGAAPKPGDLHPIRHVSTFVGEGTTDFACIQVSIEYRD